MNNAKQEWLKMKQMGLQEKRQYIWDYYKLHLFGSLILLILAGSFVNAIFINPPERNFIYIAWVNPPVATGVLDAISDALVYQAEVPDRYTVRAASYSTYGASPQVITALQTRFFAQMQLGELDLFVLTQDELLQFTENGWLIPMSQFLEWLGDSRPALRSAIEGRLAEVRFGEEGGVMSSDYVAASLSGLPFFEQLGISAEGLYIALAANTVRVGNIAIVLEVLFDG